MAGTNTLDIQVVILPDAIIKEESICLSNIISNRFDTYFVLSRDSCMPHLTLYQSAFPKEAHGTILSSLEKIASSFFPFLISFSGASTFSGSIFWDTEKNTELIELHEKIVETLNPLREGVLSEECRKFLAQINLSPQESECMNKYGNPLVMELYRPHITLTKLKNQEDEDAAVEYTKQKLKSYYFTANSMFLVEHGPYRTCKYVEIIFSFIV